MFFLSTPVSWYSKSYGYIKPLAYYVEFCTGQAETEEAIVLHYMLISIGIPDDGPTYIRQYNQGMIISSTKTDSKLKKNHVDISYHNIMECAAARVISTLKVCATVNQSDILTKVVLVGVLGSSSRAECGVV